MCGEGQSGHKEALWGVLALPPPPERGKRNVKCLMLLWLLPGFASFFFCPLGGVG